MSSDEQRPPTGPRGWPVLGHAPAFLRDKLGFLSDCAAAYGDVVELRIGARTFLLNDPEDIAHVLIGNHANYRKSERLTSRRGKRLAGSGLLTTSPPNHSAQRRLLRPLFHRDTIAGFGSMIVRNTLRTIREWEDREVEIEGELARLTLENILSALFSVDADGRKSELGDAVMARQQYIEYVFGSLLPLPEYWPTPVNLRYRRAIRRLDSFVHDSIRRRRSLSDRPDDLLSMLLDARYEDGSTMRDAQVRDEAVVFSLTGYETVGEALTWTLYLLAEYPEIAERLRADLRQCVGHQPPAVEDLPRVPYLGAVLSESMRLYPPTWIQVRVAIRDDALPGGASIPARSKIYLCQWVTHRTPRHFPNPEHFDPDRFGEQAPVYPKHAYFPFGLGPRRCLGENFALMEAALVLATTLQRLEFTAVPGQTMAPEPGVILRTRDGLRMQVRPI